MIFDRQRQSAGCSLASPGSRSLRSDGIASSPLIRLNVLETFVDQPTTLTMQPTVVLFGDGWYAHNAPHFRLTPQIRHQ